MHNLLLQCFQCISALKSMTYNPRNTEDFVRPLWTVLLFDLCNVSSLLLPSSEFRLYSITSQSYDDDPDTSIVTVAEKNANDVIPDFIVLLPIVPDDPAAILKRLQESHCIDPPFSILAGMYAPLLVELKRGPSRNRRKVEIFIKNMHTLMSAARAQVILQANCLFSSTKYSNQENVMLVAATGEWWSVMLYNREISEQFNEELYLQERSESSFLEEDDIYIHEKMYSPDNPNLKGHWLKDKEAILSKECSIPRKSAEEQAKERDERNRKRNEKKEAQSELEELSDDDEEKYFSEQTINSYYQRRMPKEDDELRFNGVARTIPDGVTLNHKWSLPMRIGSPASNFYINCIKEQLRIAADNRSY